MSATGAVTLGEQAGRVEGLEVRCWRCERHGRPRLARLIADHGAGTGQPDLAARLVAGLPEGQGHAKPSGMARNAKRLAGSAEDLASAGRHTRVSLGADATLGIERVHIAIAEKLVIRRRNREAPVVHRRAPRLEQRVIIEHQEALTSRSEEREIDRPSVRDFAGLRSAGP